MSDTRQAGLDTAYDSDQEKENEGVWHELSMLPGASIKVARAGNRQHQLALTRLRKPHRALLVQGRDLDPAVSERIAIYAIADGLLKDWRGVAWGGMEKPFSRENALEALTKFRAFREEVSMVATTEDLFQKEALEIREGNFEASSLTS